MTKLSDVKLEKLLIDTESFYDLHTEEERQQLRDEYRKVEAETNKQMNKAGGVKNWYESGRGWGG